MQRQMRLALVLLSLASPVFPVVSVSAQDPVAAAAREEAAENYRTVSAKVSRLEEDSNSTQSRLLKLTEEIHKLREQVDSLSRRNENAATLEKISRLQDAIKQVDEARQEDNKRVMAEIGRLRTFVEKALKGLATTPAPVPDETRRETPPPRTSSKPPPENSYKYKVKKGDTLSGIVAALKAEGYKVSSRQIEEANPGVNWSRLSVGREIIIPPSSPSP